MPDTQGFSVAPSISRRGFGHSFLVTVILIMLGVLPAFAARNFTSIASNGARFVAVGGGGNVLTSEDGITWTSRSSGKTTDRWGVAFNGTVFASIGDNTLDGDGDSTSTVSSPDGLTWTPRSTGDNIRTYFGLGTNGSSFVAVGEEGTTLYSANGTSWSTHFSDATSILRDVAWAGTHYVAVGDNGVILTSPDGQNWTSRSSGTLNQLIAVAWNGALIVAATGDSLYTSPDGIVWTPRVTGTGSTFFGLTWNGTLFVGVGYAGTIQTSTDGLNWTVQTSPALENINAVAWNGTRFAAVGNEGLVLTSPDGITWSIPAGLPAAPAAAPTFSHPTLDAENVLQSEHLRWRQVSEATTYHLQIGLDGSFNTLVQDSVFTDTSFTTTHLPALTRIHARVKAMNAFGESVWSPAHTFTTGALIFPSITYSPNSHDFAVNESISAVTPVSEGGPISGYTIEPSLSLNTGLNFNGATGEISGAPSRLSALTTYTIIATGDGGADTTTLEIAVSSGVPAAPQNASALVGDARAFITWQAPVNNGGSAITGYTVTASPDGADCQWTSGPLTCAITSGLNNGTEYTFTVTATNANGNSAASDPTPGLTPGVAPLISYTGTPYDFPVGAEVNEGKVNTGLPANRWTISPDLTANTGIRFNQITGRLFGKAAYPSPATTYTITAVDLASGRGDRFTISVAVTATAPEVSYASPPTFDLGTAIDPVIPLKGGGLIRSWSISPDLGAATGLQFNATSGRIFGTPTAVSSATYTVIAHGYDGTADTAELAITTSTPAPTATYATGPHALEVGEEITPIVKSLATGIISHYSISPALPAGLLFNTTNGSISGKPRNVTSEASYTITVHGPGGATPCTPVLIATTTPPIALDYDSGPYAFVLGSPITDIVKLGTTGLITHYSISPALPAGLLFNTTTGRVSGTPSAVSPETRYVATAHGPAGEGSDTILLATTTPAPTVTYDDAPFVFQLGLDGQTIAKTAATGIITHYAVEPALPAGLLFNATNGRVSGTPTAVSAATAYTITAHGPGGTGTDIVTLATETPAPTVTYDEGTFVFALGAPIEPLGRTGKTGIVTRYSITPALPSGLQFNVTTGRLFGTPAALSPATLYTITAHGPGGTGTDSLLIAVDNPPAKLMAGREAAESVRLHAERIAREGYTFTLPRLHETVEGVTLTLLDLRGRIVWIGRWSRGGGDGNATLQWDGRDRTGRKVISGRYLARYAATGKP